MINTDRDVPNVRMDTSCISQINLNHSNANRALIQCTNVRSVAPQLNVNYVQKDTKCQEEIV